MKHHSSGRVIANARAERVRMQQSASPLPWFAPQVLESLATKAKPIQFAIGRLLVPLEATTRIHAPEAVEVIGHSE